MKEQKGFTLIECIIYICLLTLIALLLSCLSMQCYRSITKYREKSSLLMMFYSSLSLLARDLKKAPPLSQWKNINENDYSWDQETTSIRWHKKGHKLMRTHKQQSSVTGVQLHSFKIEEIQGGFYLSLKMGKGEPLYQAEQKIRVVR